MGKLNDPAPSRRRFLTLAVKRPSPNSSEAPGLTPAPEPDQRFPDIASHAFEQEELYIAAGIHLSAKQPGGDHLSIIDHQHVPRTDVIDYISKSPMFQFTCLPVDYQEPGGIPGLNRLLGNQFLGQIVIKLRNLLSRGTPAVFLRKAHLLSLPAACLSAQTPCASYSMDFRF